jgi:hypothetical protein
LGQKFEVLEAVVEAVAVNVVQCERERQTAPVGDATALAFAALEPQLDKPLL